jgi:hypothetical protein
MGEMGDANEKVTWVTRLEAGVEMRVTALGQSIATWFGMNEVEELGAISSGGLNTWGESSVYVEVSPQSIPLPPTYELGTDCENG